MLRIDIAVVVFFAVVVVAGAVTAVAFKAVFAVVVVKIFHRLLNFYLITKIIIPKIPAIVN